MQRSRRVAPAQVIALHALMEPGDEFVAAGGAGGTVCRVG